MQVIGIKNNLIKISYAPTENNLILSGFLALKEGNECYICQIMHLEATNQGNIAICRFVFNFNPQKGSLDPYNGSIPSNYAQVDEINSSDILGLLPAPSPIQLGQLAGQGLNLTLDKAIFEKNLLVACDEEQNKKKFIENISNQLLNHSKKVLIIDLNGDFNFTKNIVTASKDFKLPLNYDTLNFIYEKGLDDAKAETKALIQEIFLEVQAYSKTVPDGFIPFETFKNVVDQQYAALNLTELVLLKNKLLKYYEAGVFAQTKQDFDALAQSLAQEQLTVLNVAKFEDAVQREIISFALSQASEHSKETYVIICLDNSNVDKKLLKQIYTTPNIYPTIVCAYSFKYLTELKQMSQDLILFVPIQQQSDFASYGVFLNKLNPNEFIVNGSSTHNLPFVVNFNTLESPTMKASGNLAMSESLNIVEETQFTQDEPAKTITSFAQLKEGSKRELFNAGGIANDELEKEIIRDVDSLYTSAPEEVQLTTSNVEPQIDVSQAIAEEIIPETTLTESDLDNIDKIQPEIVEEVFTQDVAEEPTPEAVIEEAPEPVIEDAAPQAPTSEPPISQMEQESPKTLGGGGIDILSPDDVTPMVPIYEAQIEGAQEFHGDFQTGEVVIHPKYGQGTVEKMIEYGSKVLISIQFDNVGRRLLDPALSEIQKAG